MPIRERDPKRDLVRYRAVKMPGQSVVAEITVCGSGFEDHPEVSVESVVLKELGDQTAVEVAAELNKAFNVGREFARQR